MSRKRRRSRITVGQRCLMVLAAVLLVVVTLTCAYKALVHPPQRENEAAGSTAAVSDVPAEEQDADQLALAAKAAHSARKSDFYTILVSGVDDGNGNSDTNILVAVDAGAGKIYGVNIPRDTKIRINGKNRKFNAAHNIGGMALPPSTVNSSSFIIRQTDAFRKEIRRFRHDQQRGRGQHHLRRKPSWV